MLEEFSSRIGKLAPPPEVLDELWDQISSLAPTALNEYARDFCRDQFCSWTSCASAAISSKKC
jgi:hypothetical protein